MFAPVFERPPEFENIQEGDDVVLRCKIRGQPSPTVIWVRHGYMLTHSNKYEDNFMRSNHSISIFSSFFRTKYLN